MHVFGNLKGIQPSETLINTVELQWLEHLRDHENQFEAGVVRANEGQVIAPGQEA